MTGFPAQKLGLIDRGLLKQGYMADVVVFDPDTIIDRADFQAPHQYPLGIEHVWVNGRLTATRGGHTGALAGQALKRNG
jgi:N-acyl-D-aspartate/D-glutamate deacylase